MFVVEVAICAKKFTSRQTDRQTDRRRTPRDCISSFHWNELIIIIIITIVIIIIIIIITIIIIIILIIVRNTNKFSPQLRLET